MTSIIRILKILLIDFVLLVIFYFTRLLVLFSYLVQILTGPESTDGVKLTANLIIIFTSITAIVWLINSRYIHLSLAKLLITQLFFIGIIGAFTIYLIISFFEALMMMA